MGRHEIAHIAVEQRDLADQGAGDKGQIFSVPGYPYGKFSLGYEPVIQLQLDLKIEL